MSNVYPHSIEIRTLSDLNRTAAQANEDYADWYVAPVMVCPNLASVLDQSNLDVMGSILDDAGVRYDVITMGHWATPYSYIVAEPTDRALEVLTETLGCLNDYPVLSDDHYSNAQYEAICEYWSSLSVDEKRELVGESAGDDELECSSVFDFEVAYQRLSESIW